MKTSREKSLLRSWYRTLPVLFGAMLTLALGVNSRAQERSPERVVIGVPSRSMTWFPAYLAQKKGFYLQEGLDLHFVQMRCPLSVAGHLSGEVDYSTCTTTIINAATTRGIPAKMFFNITGKPLHSFVVNPRFSSLREMKGAKVAINSFGTLNEMEVKVMLERNGLPPNWFILLEVPDDTGRVIALKAGSVDAALLSLPFDIHAEKLGFRTLVHMRDIMEVPFAGLGASNRKLESRPDQVRKVVRGTLRGLTYAKANRRESIELIRTWTGMEAAIAEQSYDRAAPAWTDNGIAPDKGILINIELAKQAGGVKQEVPMSRVVDWSITEAELRAAAK
jgi:NitT/TauT family transport system substrate-binding protein